MAKKKDAKSEAASGPSYTELHQPAFVTSGHMLALPLCFPGTTTPIDPDESGITALAMTRDGHIYGGTSGRSAHVFVFMSRGATGFVFDLGPLEGFSSSSAVVCGEEKVFVCANGPGGGAIFSHEYQPIPGDCLQEWGFTRKPFTRVAGLEAQHPIFHAVGAREGKLLVGITAEGIFRLNTEERKVTSRERVDLPRQKIIACPDGAVYGTAAGGRVWRFDSEGGGLEKDVAQVPGAAADAQVVWAGVSGSTLLYGAEVRSGAVFSFDTAAGDVTELGCSPLSPIRCIAATLDGRLFGICGNEMGHLFEYNPRLRVISDLGIPISVLETRRYGYEFADAAAGLDGEIYFGESDRGGHLWVYFPAIQSLEPTAD